MATYLDIVNNVLTRLREDQVTAVNQTAYSALVGRFVNDAKRIVESAWTWTALRATVVVPTVAGQKDYALTGTTNEVQFQEVINSTDKHYMTRTTLAWMVEQYELQDTVSGSPTHYTVHSVNSSGNTVVRVYPQPSAVYSLKFNIIRSQPNFTDDADVLLCPVLPVETLAFALMVAERGETGGLSAQELMQYANNMLSDAIAFDAHSNAEELVFRVV